MEPHFDEQGWVLPQGPTLESVLLNLARCSCTGKTVQSREGSQCRYDRLPVPSRVSTDEDQAALWFKERA